MAKVAGVSRRSGPRIWAAHGLKVLDVVGLYVDPPEHALVLSVDAK
jgi:hypothetical protein